MLRLIDSTGALYFEGQALERLTQKQIRPLRRHMQLVFQDPFASLSPRMTIKQIISEGLQLHYALSTEEIDRRVVTIMNEVGLEPDHRHRYPHEFSGGQRQRIAIARVLVLDPKVIFLDEPTSALDRTVQVQIVDLLRKLQSQRGLSYVFISHDIQMVKVISHQVIVMRDGHIIEHGNTQAVLNNPKQAYTQALVDTAFDDIE
jgi:microcin C transport system ATP-binding protein